MAWTLSHDPERPRIVTTSSWSTRLFNVGILCLVGACDQGRPEQLEAGAEDGWSVSLEPSVVIGGPDEREEYLLEQVMGATRLTDGRIVIADAGSEQVSFYDSLGTHLFTVGGEGEGPGEFIGIQHLRRSPGDTLLVLSRKPGLTWLSPEGQYVRGERFNLGGAAQVSCRFLGYWDLLSDGSLVTAMPDNFAKAFCPPPPPSPFRETGLIVRSTTYDGGLDTLTILPGIERDWPHYRVYGRNLVLTYGPDRVYAGDTGSDEILVLSFEGDTLDSLPSPFEARPIPSRAMRERRRRLTQPDGTEQLGSAYLYPETYPRFGRLLADAEGFLWVMAYPDLANPELSGLVGQNLTFTFVVGEGGDWWRILDRNGRVVSQIRTAPGFFPLEIGGDYILGISKDELDVQAVKLFQLNR